MTERTSLVCWGASGHALVLLDMLAISPYECTAYIDLFRPEPVFQGCPVFSTPLAFQQWNLTQGPLQCRSALLAVGRQGGHRMAAMHTLHGLGLHTPSVVSPQASVSPTAYMGEGCQLLPMAVLGAKAVLGRACILNHGAVVDHECLLADGVHVAPRATLCGQVQVGEDVFIGAGAIVLPRLTIGPRATIGAGAVVTRDVPADTVVSGNPATPHRRNT